MNDRDRNSMNPDQLAGAGGRRELPGEWVGSKSDEELRGIADDEDVDEPDEMDEEDDESSDDTA